MVRNINDTLEKLENHVDKHVYLHTQIHFVLQNKTLNTKGKSYKTCSKEHLFVSRGSKNY